MNPLVSIIIPTYNRPTLLEATIESVLEQEYEHWECLVIDDGSKKEMIIQVEKFCSKDSRIIFHSRPKNCRKGASSCRNYGLSKARGELIQFLDDDDLLDKKKIAEQIKLYSENNPFTLFTSRWGGFTETNDLKSLFKFQYHCYKDFKRGADLLNNFGLYNEYFPLHVYLTPRLLVEKSGPWNEELNNNDDAEFFTRIILNATEIVFATNARVYYRYNSTGQLSELNSEEKVKSVLKSWELIERHIKKSKSLRAVKYYKRAKDNLFKYFEKRSPEIIKDHTRFFESRNDYSSNYYKSKIALREVIKKLR